jgi:hypothetical protein
VTAAQNQLLSYLIRLLEGQQLRKRRKRKTIDPQLAFEHRQRLRDDLLSLCVTLDDISELCQAVHPDEAGFGCHDGAHSLALATMRLTHGEFPLRTEEILRWLAEIGGVCDCTINTKALKRVVKLSSDRW